MSQIPPPGGAPPMGYQTPAPQQSQGLAIGSLVCGIVSIVLFCVWFVSIPVGIVAIILGVIAKGKIARGEAGGQGLAKTGTILGIVGTLLAILWIVLLFAGVSLFGSKMEEMQKEMEQKARELEQQSQQVDTAPEPTTAP